MAHHGQKSCHGHSFAGQHHDQLAVLPELGRAKQAEIEGHAIPLDIFAYCSCGQAKKICILAAIEPGVLSTAALGFASTVYP
jgi:hypothetical protein